MGWWYRWPTNRADFSNFIQHRHRTHCIALGRLLDDVLMQIVQRCTVLEVSPIVEVLGQWRRLHTTAEGMRSDKFLWFTKNALSECVVSNVVHAKQQKDCRKRLKTDNKSVAHNFSRLRYAGSCSSIRDRPESRHTNRWEFKRLENCNACNAPRWKTQHPTLRTFYARRAGEISLFFTLLLSAHSTGCPGQFLHNRRARAPAVKLRTFYENSRQFNASTLRSLEAISVCGETIIIAHLHGNWGELSGEAAIVLRSCFFCDVCHGEASQPRSFVIIMNIWRIKMCGN